MRKWMWTLAGLAIPAAFFFGSREHFRAVAQGSKNRPAPAPRRVQARGQQSDAVPLPKMHNNSPYEVTEKAGPWWDWSAEKTALEWLFAAGLVTVAGRRGFERLYDLSERIIPADVLNHPYLDEDEAQRRLLLRSADALGVATE